MQPNHVATLALCTLALHACGSCNAGAGSESEGGASGRGSESGASVVDAGASIMDGGAGVMDGDASVMDGGANVRDGGASIMDGSASPDGSDVVPGGVRWVGRVDSSNPSAVKFAWSGTGLVAVVNGTKISAALQTEGSTSTAFFQPVIDGLVGARFQVQAAATQTVVLGSGLAAGDHTVELYRESEGMYGDSVFLGFVDGVLKGAPRASGRLIEIIGDSISAGYGNLGNEVHPPWDNTCTFSLDTESAYQAYGMVMGRTLNAEVSIIARSGWGMYRDSNGNTSGVLSSIYNNALGTESAPKWDFKRQADAVVIDLGTNDTGETDGGQGDPGAAYEDAYVAFLHTLRGFYPGAWVFLTIGPMTSDPLLSQLQQHITNVVARVGDPKINAVTMAPQDSTKTGCDYHPNVAEDRIMADVLTTAIKTKLGW